MEANNDRRNYTATTTAVLLSCCRGRPAAVPQLVACLSIENTNQPHSSNNSRDGCAWRWCRQTVGTAGTCVLLSTQLVDNCTAAQNNSRGVQQCFFWWRLLIVVVGVAWSRDDKCVVFLSSREMPVLFTTGGLIFLLSWSLPTETNGFNCSEAERREERPHPSRAPS